MFGLSLWTDVRLRTKGLIAVAAPAAATVIIACTSYLIADHMAAAEQAVRQTLEAKADIQRLVSSQEDATGAIRGYFLSREPVYAGRTRRSLATFDEARTRLAKLVAGDARQMERLAAVAGLERARADLIFGAKAGLDIGSLSQSSLSIRLKAAEAGLARSRSLLHQMELEEDDQLGRRSQLVENLRWALKAIAIGCLLLGVLGGTAISLMFASGITNRIVSLRQNVARLTSGEPLNRLPGGRDEIGALSEGFTQAAEALRLRSAALENALQGIAEADIQDRHVRFNKAYAELASLTDVRTAPGLPDIVHPEDRQAMTGAIRQMRETGRAEVEVRIASCAGQMTPVAATLLLCAEDGPGYFVFLRDISQRKEAEAALVLAKDAAVASREARTKFLAKVSHDIRTPLNAILGAADLLSQTRLTADQSQYVGMFQRNSRRLVALINDFLDFSKIESGSVRLEHVPFQIREIIHEALATFHETASRKGIGLQAEISPDLPEWLLGDPLRIQQVLVNLLSNGLKFTQAGRVRVRVTQAQGAGEVRFEVEDTGPGISPENQTRIFAEFEQIPNQPDCGHGSGLGLMICRELVEQMKGRISVTSELGMGSIFRVELPLAPASNPMRRRGEEPVRVAAGRGRAEVLRILAAEDTEDNQLLLNFYLRGEALELHFVHNGQEAVDAFRRGERFDLVLMDLDMPVLDGFAATRAIREWEKERGQAPTAVVGLSAHVLDDTVAECLKAGCTAHVAKPIDKGKLLETIQRYAPPAAPREVPTGQSGDVKQLAPWYLASLSGRIEEARVNLGMKKLKALQRLGHNLRGTGSGYGFPRIAEIGQEIEALATGGDEHAIAGQLDALYRFVSAAQEETSVEHAKASSDIAEPRS